MCVYVSVCLCVCALVLEYSFTPKKVKDPKEPTGYRIDTIFRYEFDEDLVPVRLHIYNSHQLGKQCSQTSPIVRACSRRSRNLLQPSYIHL